MAAEVAVPPARAVEQDAVLVPWEFCEIQPALANVEVTLTVEAFAAIAQVKTKAKPFKTQRLVAEGANGSTTFPPLRESELELRRQGVYQQQAKAG
jgi:hypothetical protein